MMITMVITTLTACGVRVEVPPAHVGKLSTKSGMQEGIILPSKLRLGGFCFTCDSLILAEASDFQFKESMMIFMPIDQLNLTVDVRGIVTISTNEANLNSLYDKIPAIDLDRRLKIIPMSKTYGVYGETVIRSAVRSVVTKYSIDHIMTNRESVSEELRACVREKMNTSPLSVIQFELANIQPPDVIVIAQEQRKEREIAIEKAQADKQVALAEAEAALEVALKQQELDLKEAETQRMVNEQLAQGVNQAFIAQRGLKVLEIMARSPNKIIIIPEKAFSNPAMVIGMVTEAFKPAPAVESD